MLKKSLLFVVLLVSARLVLGGELPDDCEAAVDAADRLGADSNKHCDYSKTGLNGALHKAFANKGTASETTSGEAPTRVAEASTKTNLPATLAREFGSEQQLGTVRYELLQLASKDCAAGFVLLEERYLPAAARHLTLELKYRCL